MSAVVIPWEDAREFAKAHGLDQIIVHGFRHGDGQCVATWGNTIRDSDQAAQGGNHIKKALLGWPDSAACAVPDRVMKAREALERARKVLEPMARQVISPRDNFLYRTVQQIDEALALFSESKRLDGEGAR